MSLSHPNVMVTQQNDSSANFTVSFAEDDHKFSVFRDGNTAVVEYEETLSWKGVIRVSEPDETVFKALMTSDEMTAFLEENGLEGVRRL